jgi:CBS domain-containing protein
MTAMVEQTREAKPKKERSYKAKVILWTLVLLVVDEVTIGIPEADLVLIWVVLFRPRWFLDMVHRLYQYLPHKRAWRPVREVCRREVVTVFPTTTVAEAVRLMRDRQERGLIVVEQRQYLPAREEEKPRKFWQLKRAKKSQLDAPSAGEKILVPVGILSDRDISLKLGVEGLRGDAVTVAQVMNPEFEVAFESEDIHSAVEKMREAGMRRLPVVDARGNLVGVLRLDDAIAVLADGLNAMVTLLQREVQQEAQSRAISSSFLKL